MWTDYAVLRLSRQHVADLHADAAHRRLTVGLRPKGRRRWRPSLRPRRLAPAALALYGRRTAC